MTMYCVMAVKDSALEAFALPFFTQTVNVAIRSFTDEANRSDSNIRSHPTDYDLYHIGTYDDAKGYVEALPEPVRVSRAQDVLRDPGGSA